VLSGRLKVFAALFSTKVSKKTNT